jgi:tetratricopeptide (TPR) repeat protein
MALNLKDFRFLIVDDLREMRITLRSMLETLQAKQFWDAKNAEEALEVLKTHPIDIVLCDYNLGDSRDGQQVFEEARGRGVLLPHAAWVMITAEQSMGMVMGVVENNPDGYLVKPINKAVLQARLERAVGRKMIVKDVETALRNGKFTEAVGLAEMQVQRYPALRGELLRLKSEALLRNGDFDAAAEFCAGLLAERQQGGAEYDQPWMLLALGRAQHELGDIRQARITFQKIIEQNPAVMEAYDLLAQIEREQGQSKDAQRILAQALGVSSRSVRRQQALGDVAAANQDFSTAERAYGRALTMGEDSCFARPDDATGLVAAMVETKGNETALRTMGELLKRASRKRGARGPHWQLSSMEASLLVTAGRGAEALAAAERALEGYRDDPAPGKAEATLALVKACFATGLDDQARGMVDKLVRENHDRTDVLESVQVMFSGIGMDAAGSALIEQAQQAIVKINNEGVLLAKAGRYKEAVAQLQKAAEELPNNLTVTLNVLQALLLQMQAEGLSNQSRYQAREHLARAERLAPKSEKVQQLKIRLQTLVAAAARQAAG